LGPSFNPVGLAVRTAPGSDVDQLKAEHPPPSPDIELVAAARQRPSDIIQLHALSEVPFLLAGVLAALALVVAVHAVWSAAQRRRREHAVLRALGWRPRDSRAGVLWHAVGIMLLAVLAGLPIGLVAGRWLWRRLAAFLGTVPVSVAPLVTLLIAAAIFGLVAVAAAVIPAQRAARRPPAVALRVE
jgi:ABC-type lipoprotein release transport system permease subunit